MKAKIETKLKSVKTLNDLLNVLQSEYQTTECVISVFIRNLLVMNICAMLQNTNAIINEKLKQKVVLTNTVDEFINCIRDNYDCNRIINNTENIVSNTKALVTLTRLKEIEEKIEVLQPNKIGVKEKITTMFKRKK